MHDDYAEFQDIEVPDGVKAAMEEDRLAWEDFMTAMFPPSFHCWWERAEAGEISIADTGAWMTQLRRDQEAELAALPKDHGRALGQAMERMVRAPGFVDYMYSMKRASWAIARRRAQQDDFATALLRWFQELNAADGTKVGDLVLVVGKYYATRHETFPAAAESFRHIEQMPDEPTDDADDIEHIVFGRRAAQAFMDAYGDLSELRYKDFISFMYELLTTTHPPRKTPRHDLSFGEKTNQALKLMETHYPSYRDLLDGDAFKLRNGRAHVYRPS